MHDFIRTMNDQYAFICHNILKIEQQLDDVENLMENSYCPGSSLTTGEHVTRTLSGPLSCSSCLYQHLGLPGAYPGKPNTATSQAIKSSSNRVTIPHAAACRYPNSSTAAAMTLIPKPHKCCSMARRSLP